MKPYALTSSLVKSIRRVSIQYGSSLFISSLIASDSGIYVCVATNSANTGRLELQLNVVATLKAHIQPGHQTVDLGRSAELLCTITGYPRSAIWWLKDGQPLRTGSRVRLLSKEHIQITAVSKEDRGMYQCFTKNEQDIVQASAEMKLGGK